MTKSEKELLLRNYVGFSQILRTWLSTYGIGFFIFIVAQDHIVESLKESPCEARLILAFIMVGLIIQVLAALIYKFSTAYVYDTYGKKPEDYGCHHKLSLCLDSSYFLEMVFDIATISLYVLGTYKIVALVTGVA